MRATFRFISLNAIALLIFGGLLSPTYAQSRRDLKSCQNYRGDPDAEIVACSKLIRARAKLRRRHAPASAIAALFAQRGNAYVKKGNYSLALADYNMGIQIAPHLGIMLAGRGRIYYLQRDYTDALIDYINAILLGYDARDQKTLYVAYVGRGWVNFADGELDNALADFNRAIHIGTKDPEDKMGVHMARARVLEFIGETERAKEDYKRALRANPKKWRQIEDAMELDIYWIAYLKGIQDAGDYANWRGPPLELLRKGSDGH